MGFRFQKRVKILPGVRVNLSKSGVSTSIGVKGAQVTLGHGKTRTTVGLPGSGISHSTVTSNNKQPQELNPQEYIAVPNQQTHWFIQIAKAVGAIVGVIAVVALGVFAGLMASATKGKRR